jgi:hypothetical protein
MQPRSLSPISPAKQDFPSQAAEMDYPILDMTANGINAFPVILAGG